MKYIRFTVEGFEKFGVISGDEIIELQNNFLIDPEEQTGKTYALDEVKILPPVQPGKVIVIGLNYIKHAEEVNMPLPDEPMMFMVSPTAIVGHMDEIAIPYLEHKTDFEAELTIVIGKEAKDVERKKALDYVFGYTIANDVSDRHLQQKDGQFTRAKSFDTFKPLGPVVRTGIDPNHLEIKLIQNGKVKQHSNTRDFVFSVEAIIEQVTKVMTLHPGDIILTGTPSGVDAMQPGDVIEIEIEGIGKLVNHVVEK